MNYRTVAITLAILSGMIALLLCSGVERDTIRTMLRVVGPLILVAVFILCCIPKR